MTTLTRLHAPRRLLRLLSSSGLRVLSFSALLFAGRHTALALPALGDLDDDGEFTVLDLARLAGHIQRTQPLSAQTALFADINQDGTINSDDQQALVQLIVQSRTPEALPPASVRFTSPADGEGDVAVTRETIVHFTLPLALSATLDTTKFRAEFGGRKILSRVDLSSDRKKATLFYLEPLPSSARIQVALDGSGLNDLLGRPIALGPPPSPGGPINPSIFQLSFDTISITPVAATAIKGRVFASKPAATANGQPLDTPLAGVTITVDGAEETLRTVTDAAGNFTLTPCPAGSFFVHVDGRTSPASSWPNGDYYPTVGKRWEALAGRTDNLSGNSEDTSRGTIYLPCVCAGTLQTVSAVADTKITFPASVLAEYPALAGTELTVPANSLFADDGTRGGKVGIAPVPPTRLPSPLPPGLNPAIVFTVQSDGGSNFDRPVPVCFPNLPDTVTGQKLAPGAKSALWSFNHDIGSWEIAGAMTVTEDGLLVKTDVGVGVRQPGWNISQPGSQGTVGLQPLLTPPVTCNLTGLLKDSSQVTFSVGMLLAPLAASATVMPWLIAGSVVAGLASAWDDWYNEDVSPGTFIGAADTINEAMDMRGAVLLARAQGSTINFRGLAIAILKAELSTENGRLARVISRISSFGSKAANFLGVVSAIDTIYKKGGLKDKWSECFGGARRNRRDNFAYEEFAADLAVGSEMMDKFLLDLLGAKLTPLVPTDRSVVLASSQDKIRILELDGSDYLDPRTGEPFEVPVVDLMDERFGTDVNFRISLSKNISEGTRKYAAALSPDNPSVRNLAEEMNGIVEAGMMQMTEWYYDGPGFIGPGWFHAKGTFFRAEGPDMFGEKLYQFRGVRLSGRAYYRVTNAFTGEIVSRNVTLSSSNLVISFIAPPDTPLLIEVVMPGGELIYRSSQSPAYIPYEKCYGSAGVISPSSGSAFNLSGVAMVTDSVDTDSDGLGDSSEVVVGTNPSDPDTDNDGIQDGVEVQQGTDPLDGLAVRTGVLASAPVTGHAKDICTVNNTAITANGSSGISVFNVLNGLNPVRLIEVDTLGSALSVACYGSLIAVADYIGGLAMVDISDARDARIVHTVDVGAPATCVVTNGPLAYVGTAAGRIAAVDLLTGNIRWRIAMGTDPVHDVTVAGDVLYVARGAWVDAISIATAAPVVGGSTAVTDWPFTRPRLAVGAGVLYVSHSQGWDVLDIAANPLEPARVAQAGTGQGGFRQIVPTGSGLAVSVSGITSGSGDLDLYDISADGRGNAFLTTHPTPGLAEAVSVYNGLAYVADGSSGLQVVNYRAYDALGQAPTISLSSNFNLAAGTAEEGALMRLTASVSDDVQVRNVEYYVDGALVLTDGNFPFEHRFVTPAISPQKTTFTVRGRATDTGGNATWTPEITLTLVPDATPPQVLAFFPANNDLTGAISDLSVSFTEPMNLSTLESGLILAGAGPDGVAGNADDVVIAGAITFAPETRTAYFHVTPALSPGLYRLKAVAPASDAAGNAMTAAASSTFRVFSFTDTDGDGVPDDWENVLGLNANNADSNNNGINDGNEDSDNDGLRNSAEIVLGTDPRLKDSNGNGINDGVEDRDFDGLTDAVELTLGTDWLNPDTDGDGVFDEAEVTGGSNPRDSTSRPFSPAGSVLARQAFVNVHRFVPELNGFIYNSQAPVRVNRFVHEVDGFALSSQPPVHVHRLSLSSGDLAAGSVIGYQPAVRVNRFVAGAGAGPIIATPPVKVYNRGP